MNLKNLGQLAPITRKISYLAAIIAMLLIMTGSKTVFALTDACAIQPASYYYVAATLGGLANDKELLIQMLDDQGRMGVYQCDATAGWVVQVFGGGSKGSLLVVNGIKYLSGYFSGTNLSSDTTNTKILSDGNTHQSVWNAADGSFKLTQFIHYLHGEQYYSLTWQIENTGFATLSNLKFFHGEDTYFSGNDRGSGTWDPVNFAVGVTNANGAGRKMQLQSAASYPPAAYESDNYSYVWSAVNNQLLTDIIDPYSETDNGYALQWNKDFLAPGAKWTINAYEKFADVIVNNGLSVSAPGVLQSCTVGIPCILNFSVSNSSAPQTVALSAASDHADWPLSLVSSSISAPTGNTVVPVTLTLPASAANGATGKVTLTANGTTNDFVNISVVNTHTVTYNGNGNTGGTVPAGATAYPAGATVTVLGSGTLTKTGYTFAGWNSAANGSGTSRAAASTFAMGSANVTLYAQWTVPTFTVTYNGNGNTGGTVPAGATAYPAGATVTVLGSGTLTKTGYTFAGWNSAANGSGTSRAAASTFAMGSANVTLYAQWTVPTFTVTYNGNGNTGGTVPAGATAYPAGATVTVLGSGTLTKTGYTFAGWNSAANGSGTSRAAASTFAMGSANVTLYAQWTVPTFTVTYNGNGNTGGTVPAGATAYPAGATVTVLGSGTLTKTGYTFAGWNSAANGSGTSRAAASTFAMGSANVTLYAQWTVPTFTVTYNGNGNTGGTVPAGATAYTAGATVTVLGSGTLTKTGYTFAGWNSAANGSGTSRAAASTFAMGSANVTLYAQWTLVPTFTVTPSGGTNGSISPATPQTVNSGNTQQFTITPKSGYTANVTGCGGTLSGTTFTTGPITAPCTVNATFVITTPPIISQVPNVLTNENSHTINGRITSVDLPANVQISVDGIVVATLVTAADGSFSAQVPFSAEKTYNITIKATDSSANQSNQNLTVVYTTITIADALKAYKIAEGFNLPTAADLSRLDVAGGASGGPDGKIDLIDVLLLLRKSTGMVL